MHFAKVITRVKWIAVSALVIGCRGEVAPGSDPLGAAASRLAVEDEGRLEPLVSSAADRFGTSVAVAGDIALVGVSGADELGDDSGAVVVFVRGESGWTEQQRLTAFDAQAGDRFGHAVALDGDVVFVGAPQCDGFGGSTGGGAVYVFERQGSSWSGGVKLEQASSDDVGDCFGWSVAVSGDAAIVGAPNDGNGVIPFTGAAYLFVQNGTWQEAAALTPPDVDDLESADVEFGASVALDDTGRALVGAPAHPGESYLEGAAYVYGRDGAQWMFEALLHTVGYAEDYAGYSVAIEGTTALLGANHLYVGQTGAYVYTEGDSGWSLQQKLVPDEFSDNGAGGSGGFGTPGFESFGWAVALAGDVALVGLPNGEPDATYVFARNHDEWTQAAKIADPDQQVNAFGASLAFDGARAVIGAPGKSGAAYVVAISSDPNGSPCTDADACSSGFCVDGVCCDSACGGGADDCQACSVVAGGFADGVCGALTSTAADRTVCRPSVDNCDAEEVCTSTSTSCPEDEKIIPSCEPDPEPGLDSEPAPEPSEASGCDCKGARGGTDGASTALTAIALAVWGRRRRSRSPGLRPTPERTR